MKTTATETKWLVQYQPTDEYPWMVSGSFSNEGNAAYYLANHKATRPNVKWRMVHRVTVTTVTEEVVE